MDFLVNNIRRTFVVIEFANGLLPYALLGTSCTVHVVSIRNVYSAICDSTVYTEWQWALFCVHYCAGLRIYVLVYPHYVH